MKEHTKVKKLISIFLVFLLVFPAVFQPHPILAKQTSESENLYKLAEVTKEFSINDEITVLKGTKLYILESEKDDEVLIQYNDKRIEFSKDHFEILNKNEVKDYPEFKEDTNLADTEITLDKETELFSLTNHTEPTILVNSKINYSKVEGDISSKALLLGNTLFRIGSKFQNDEEHNVKEEPPAFKAEEQPDLIDDENGSSLVENNNELKEDSSKKKQEQVTNSKNLNQEKSSLESGSNDISVSDEKSDNSIQISSTDINATSFQKYFKVTSENLPIYDNRTGELIQIGVLKKGEIYPRVSDYGNWHKIKFDDYYAYVRKSGTTPNDGGILKNENTNYYNTNKKFVTSERVTVYDNSSGSLVPFGEILPNKDFSIVDDYGNWWRVLFSDRVGYVRKSDVESSFTQTDKNFVANKDLIVYDNRGSGPLKAVGTLKKGQTYPRVSDYGNWHRIKFGNFYGYVKKSETSHAIDIDIKNLNKSYSHHSRTFTVLNDVTVYDNTSGRLVAYGEIKKGTQFPIVSDYGDWWRILFADRVGFIKKSKVKVETRPTDYFFRAFGNLPVYDNRGGSLSKVGELINGQSYVIHDDYGKWWKVNFGDFFGYVNKSQTGYASSSEIPNRNMNYNNSQTRIITNATVKVYDNSGSGGLKAFGEIEKDTIYPVVSDYGNWWRILYLGRVGYIRKSEVSLYSINYSNYNISLDEAVQKQMKVKPQTDTIKDDLYVHWSAFESLNGTSSGVIGDGWRVRLGPSTNYHTVYVTNSNLTVKLNGFTRDNAGAKWWRVERSSLPYWLNATYEEVKYNMNPKNFVNDDIQKYQFLDLKYFTNIPASELKPLLANKGILNGKEAVFRSAAKNAKINELYLISHAILETGHGTSTLANGVPVDSKGNVTTNSKGVPTWTSKSYKYVYNMYGIGATDGCAIACGAKKAFDQKWFTPDQAIIGGAQFAKNNYIYSGQNTLYKMRWNPAALVSGNPSHQYATDVGWASKQVYYYTDYYSTGKYSIYFDIPIYNN